MNVDVLPGSEPFVHRAGSSGVLVLHGFTGNPSTMRDIAGVAADAGWSVSLPRLPGHGTRVEDLAATTWADWSGAALEAFDDLAATCTSVGVVGLSMGGALCAYVSERRDVAGCVFINPFVSPVPAERREMVDQLLAAGVEIVDAAGSDIKREGDFRASYDATSLRAAKSLFDGVAAVYDDLAKVTAPSLLLSSREDHVVTPDNGDALMERVSGPIERVWLENSYHVATLDHDRSLVESLTVDFLARVLSS